MFPSEFVLNVSLEKRGRTANGGFNSGRGLAGARLVRLTRTPIVILYAQPKTPTYSTISGSEPEADRGPRAGSPRGVVDATGSYHSTWFCDPVATAPGSDSKRRSIQI